jgi:hypothetical protein
MDLRSFGQHSRGCIFELQQLLRRVPSDHIVLVCDKTTDLPLLRRIMTDAWNDARRLGAAEGTGRIALVRVERHSPGELRVLMDQLVGRIAPAPAVSASELRAPA